MLIFLCNKKGFYEIIWKKFAINDLFIHQIIFCRSSVLSTSCRQSFLTLILIPSPFLFLSIDSHQSSLSPLRVYPLPNANSEAQLIYICLNHAVLKLSLFKNFPLNFHPLLKVFILVNFLLFQGQKHEVKILFRIFSSYLIWETLTINLRLLCFSCLISSFSCFTCWYHLWGFCNTFPLLPFQLFRGFYCYFCHR